MGSDEDTDESTESSGEEAPDIGSRLRQLKTISTPHAVLKQELQSISRQQLGAKSCRGVRVEIKPA